MLRRSRAPSVSSSALLACVLASYINGTKMSELVFRLLIRLARYIVSTRDLTLTLRSKAPSGSGMPQEGLDLFRGFVDSSHGNGPFGRSYGGFILLCDGGGALAWKMAAPIAGDDSSGAAELRMGTLAYKYILALRTLQTDLDGGVAPISPTLLFSDAQAIIDGTGCERACIPDGGSVYHRADSRHGCGECDSCDNHWCFEKVIHYVETYPSLFLGRSLPHLIVPCCR